MGRKVEVGAVCEPVELFVPKREFKFEIDGALGIMRTVAVGYFELGRLCSINTYRGKPSMHFEAPIFERFCPIVRSDKILDLHLLELARTEDEITRCDFVAKRLADLGDTERQLRME